MRGALFLTAVALIASALLLGALRIALPARFLAPGQNARSNHRAPARQLGGLAAFPAAIFACLFAAPASSVLLLAAPFGLLWLSGLIDDFRPLGVLPRFLAQFAAALALVLIANPLPGFLDFLPVWLAQSLIVVFLVWCINMVNFMDGLDQITAAGAGLPLALAGLLLVLAAPISSPALAALVGGGAVLGFALHNRTPARVFLGDTGSLPLGLAMGWTVLTLADLSSAAALAPFAYYFADSASTLIKRLMEGKNILNSHSEHAYQTAYRAGMTVNAITGRVALASLAGSLAALAALSASNVVLQWVWGMAGLVVGIGLTGALRRFSALHRA